MKEEKIKAIIEAILFSAGRIVTKNELIMNLEISDEELEKVIQKLKQKYDNEESGIELIKIENGYQLCTKKELY